MDEYTRQLYRVLYKKSFYEFAKAFWNEADPSKFTDGRLLQFYCETFQYMCRDWVGYKEIEIKGVPEQNDQTVVIDVRQNKRKININVPPRHSKSMIFNVLAAVWLWTQAPIKAVSISHTEGLAGKMNTMRKKIINSAKFKFFFPEIALEANSNTMLRDSRGGELYSLNRNAMTGYGGDVIINDDLTNAEAARKDKEEMFNAWSYYQNTMPSRINDINKCIIMNIQQRLAPNDITGHILNDERLRDTYVFVVLPAIFEKHTYLVCPISGNVFEFKPGDPLWPERFGDYSSVRADVGETIFQTQYLQKPIASDRTVIKEDMVAERDACDCPGFDFASRSIDTTAVSAVYASHDFPVKDKESSDFLGSLLAYKMGSTLYVVDCLEKRMAFVDSVKYVKSIDNVYPGSIQIIEDKANGSPILQQLQDEVPGLQAFQPGTASKVQRLESASLYMTSGNVVFVKSVYDKMTNSYRLPNGLQNLKDRLLGFPFVEHDDICDAFSMCVLFVFMDKRFAVYGRALNDLNIFSREIPHYDYSTVFFNREGDIWKAAEIGVQYGAVSKAIVLHETIFRADLKGGIRRLKEFANGKTVLIDCSLGDSMMGMFQEGMAIERYEVDDFERSVSSLNLALSNKNVLISRECKMTLNDLESFKFDKSKDETARFKSQKDGFGACLRVALKYYGGI